MKEVKDGVTLIAEAIRKEMQAEEAQKTSEPAKNVSVALQQFAGKPRLAEPLKQSTQELQTPPAEPQEPPVEPKEPNE